MRVTRIDPAIIRAAAEHYRDHAEPVEQTYRKLRNVWLTLDELSCLHLDSFPERDRPNVRTYLLRAQDLIRPLGEVIRAEMVSRGLLADYTPTGGRGDTPPAAP